ncbi:hypothetical protein [Adlercreutzia equolifaciens]|uniref:hypothetical protein n=1 Tax=Adlercreutzia equolifaciens TaxID=446660 RepID=UPI00266D68B8|nr:hypothetical protein [Adlercreutzia equolifaciens]
MEAGHFGVELAFAAGSENAGGAFVWRGGFAPFATFGIYRSFEFRSVRARGNQVEKHTVLQ